MEKVNDTYARDNSTGALISTDYAGLAAYKKRKKLLKEKSLEMDKMSNDINSLKEELFEIKSVLQTIVQKI